MCNTSDKKGIYLFYRKLIEKKRFRIFLIVLCIFIGIFLLGLIPYGLVLMNNIIKDCFIKDRTYLYLKDSDFVNIMTSLLDCVITAILSVMAYRLTKLLGRAELAKQRMDIIAIAEQITKTLEANNGIIFEVHKNLYGLKPLTIDEGYGNNILLLKMENIITEEESVFLKEYYKIVVDINDKVKISNDVQKKELAQKYFSRYIRENENSHQMEHMPEMKSIIEKLGNISGGNGNV